MKYWLFSLCLCVSVVTSACKREPELTRFYPLPDFSLTDQTEKTVRLADLKGKVWVADFIFTSCGGTCPMMTMKMADLQGSLKNAKDVKLVSFTVDPERDDAARLKTYAGSYNADNERWLFLTGEHKQMQKLAKTGFHLTVEDGTDPNEPIIHSQRFVLVDTEGHIRGYYNSDDDEAKQKILTDIGELLREAD